MNLGNGIVIEYKGEFIVYKFSEKERSISRPEECVIWKSLQKERA